MHAQDVSCRLKPLAGRASKAARGRRLWRPITPRQRHETHGLQATAQARPRAWSSVRLGVANARPRSPTRAVSSAQPSFSLFDSRQMRQLNHLLFHALGLPANDPPATYGIRGMRLSVPGTVRAFASSSRCRHPYTPYRPHGPRLLALQPQSGRLRRGWRLYRLARLGGPVLATRPCSLPANL